MVLDHKRESLSQAALIVVDLQEDFCPPHGSLAVQGGRKIVSAINELLALPFKVTVATQDWHPKDHVSFASNHDPPNNKPFESVVEVRNPANETESQLVRLWPVHCVQNSLGGMLIPELDVSRIHHIVKKGTDARVEMFSAFRDANKNPCVSNSGLLQLLQEAEVSEVYVTGLATNHCVKETAIHAAEKFATAIVSEATKSVDQSEEGLATLTADLSARGVRFVHLEDILG
ncbi:MAG: NAD(+) salvage pathway protein [Chrysothrix sp. TS-e1954]|nr:MAG: NAD(+) salvage pathway protein [Chrysothrix sp. TS-e1954]